MKLTKQQLKQIIKEKLSSLQQEALKLSFPEGQVGQANSATRKSYCKRSFETHLHPACEADPAKNAKQLARNMADADKRTLFDPADAGSSQGSPASGRLPGFRSGLRLTREQLKQIIKEELDTLISEGLFDRLQGLLGRDPEEDEHPLDKYGQGKRKPSRAARPAQPDTAAGWTPQGREGFKWENIQIQGRPSINAYIMKDARSPRYKLILTTESGEEIANKSVSTELKTVTGLVDKLVSSSESPPLLYKDLWKKVYGSVNEVTITKEQLKQIIKEELEVVLSDAEAREFFGDDVLEGETLDEKKKDNK